MIVSFILLVLFIPFSLLASFRLKLALRLAVGFTIAFYAIMAPVSGWFFHAGYLAQVNQETCGVFQAYSNVFKDQNPLYWVSQALVLTLAGVALILVYQRYKLSIPPFVSMLLIPAFIINVPVLFEVAYHTDFLDKNGYRMSKPFYFSKTGFTCITGIGGGARGELPAGRLYQSKRQGESFPFGNDYPLVRLHESKNCLEGLLVPDPGSNFPDIILVVAEGLSDKLIHNHNGALFMPFLNGLANRGLYYQNFLATSSGRQNALASLTGGLPYGNEGFTQLTLLPYHFSLINVLGKNGYSTSFYTGQWTWIKATDKFLTLNHTDVIRDADDFPPLYNRVIVGEDDYFWGFNDKDLFDFYVSDRLTNSQIPRFDIIQTGSMRPPFAMEQHEMIEDRFNQLLNSLPAGADRNLLISQKEYLTAAMFADDALKNLFQQLENSGSWHNTIVLVAGNTPMPQLSAGKGLAAYHVPLIVYSPLLSQPEVIHDVRTQKDLYETIIGFLAGSYGLKIPTYSASLGSTLCEQEDQLPPPVPFSNAAGNISSLLFDNHFLDADGALHKLTDGLGSEPVKNERLQLRMTKLLEAFRELNNNASTAIMPDSLFFDFFRFELIKDTTVSARRIRTEFRDIITDLPITRGTHYIDVRMRSPQVSLEEVYIVFELRNQADSLIQWENFGIPAQKDDFSVRILVDDNPFDDAMVRIFLWNESPVPYGFDHVRTTIYRQEADKDDAISQIEMLP